MYHSISDRDEPGRRPYYRTVTASDVFGSQMRLLRECGYRTIGLNEAGQISGKAVAGRRVIITFDDGFRDFHTHAFPILSRFGFTATMFLPTAYIANERRQFNGIECLTWSEVRELERSGMVFGSHTVTHPQLRTLSLPAVRRELEYSKEAIEDKIGRPVTSFSYPYAFPEADRNFCRELRTILGECGYTNGVSTTIGTAGQRSDVFFYKRLPVNSCDDARLFAAKIEGAYDWLHSAQYALKLLGRPGRKRQRSLPA
jgi:peptidoglycan/xylan/chitin deacetylase (PgdA/CDA1 family)